MPTRPQTWRFHRTYDGFAHAGLVTAIDPSGTTPIDRAGRVVRINGLILDGGRVVGRFTRLLADDPDRLRARHETIELDPAVRGRGFARALHAHAEAAYRDLGVAYVTTHAEDVGSLLWPRLGFDFDLRRLDGATEAERRAHAVAALFSPDARPVAGRLRPAETLTQWASSPDPSRRTAAAALRERLPSAARPAGADLLLDPLALAAFDAHGTRLGRDLMLGASWDAIKPLTAGG